MKFTWLIVRYGARIVLPLLIATQRMPMSLTDHQLLAYMRDAIHQQNDASDTDIEAICHKLTQECSNLTSELAIALNTSTTFCSTLFAPPTRECIICQRRLVSYHTTDVIYCSVLNLIINSWGVICHVCVICICFAPGD